MPSSPLARALLFLGIGLAVLAIGVAAWLWTEIEQRQAASSGSVATTGTALIGGPFELVDQAGAARSDRDFLGRYMLIYFGYVYCPDVCPTSLASMSQALDILAKKDPDKAAKVVPIFITVDPARDTVDIMRTYAENFHPDLVALTGSEEQVAKAAKAYRVYYAKVGEEGSDDYLMDHSSFIYLMGPDGAYLAHFTHTATPDEIAQALDRYVKS
jgi:protein SCO1/2